MIHLVKSKTGYQVIHLADNGQVLSTSEILSTKAKCWKNCTSLHNSCFISLAAHLFPGLVVQDDTLPQPKVYFLNAKGQHFKHHEDPKPKYVPGVNKRKKKGA